MLTHQMIASMLENVMHCRVSNVQCSHMTAYVHGKSTRIGFIGEIQHPYVELRDVATGVVVHELHPRVFLDMCANERCGKFKLHRDQVLSHLPKQQVQRAAFARNDQADRVEVVSQPVNTKTKKQRAVEIYVECMAEPSTSNRQTVLKRFQDELGLKPTTGGSTYFHNIKTGAWT